VTASGVIWGGSPPDIPSLGTIVYARWLSALIQVSVVMNDGAPESDEPRPQGLSLDIAYNLPNFLFA